jgi:hypothetical protein
MQCTSHILMIRPAKFGFNPETAASNAFQSSDTSLSVEEISEKAKNEFDYFVSKLTKCGIHIHVVEDTELPHKPDAVFPNNWFTTHEDGMVITYPMQAIARRRERREDILEGLGLQFRISNRYNLEDYEEEGKFLEGTGSLIPDRTNKLVYACISPRTDPDLVNEYCRITAYKPVLFVAKDKWGLDIYHTNVMMCMGDTFVVICLDSVQNTNERSMLVEMFEKTGKTIIDITLEQMNSFAGNMLQVCNDAGKTYLVMSSQAYASLRPDQIETILKHTEILHAPIPIIEKFGGGSARCMMAEIFLPQRK